MRISILVPFRLILVALALAAMPLHGQTASDPLDTPASPTASESKKQALLVIFDFTEQKFFDDMPRVFVLPGTTTVNAYGEKQPLAEVLTNAAGAGADLPIREALQFVQGFEDDSVSRWIGTRGDVIGIYSFYDMPKDATVTATARVRERKRATQLASDIPTLIKLAAQTSVMSPQTVAIALSTHTLEKTRANVSVVARLDSTPVKAEGASSNATAAKPAASGPLTAPAASLASIAGSESAKADDVEKKEAGDSKEKVETSDKAKADAKPTRLEAHIITGPREPWFLSADLPINDVTKVKFNESKNDIGPEGDAGNFYVGVNYTFGDAILKDGAFVLKGLIQASSKPLESCGIAIGMRGITIPGIGLELDAISPFVGMTFTKEDEKAADGTVTKNTGRNSEWRWGVSLNLDSALAWLGGGGEKKDEGTGDDAEKPKE